MADTGWQFPGSGVSKDFSGDRSWAAASNITADDGSNSTIEFFGAGEFGNGLEANNWDWSAVNGTIDGIEVRLGDYESDAALTWFRAKLLLEGAEGSLDRQSEYAAWGAVQTEDKGGAFDLWNETPTPTELDATTSGFFIVVDSNASSVIGEVDFIQMKIYYTPASDTGWVTAGSGSERNTGTFAWINESNITSDDGNDASCSNVSASQDSHSLEADNFDFSSIPTQSRIDGIEVRIGDYSSTQTPTWERCVLVLSNDTQGATSRHSSLTAPSGSLQTDEAGDSSDLWGETLTVSDVQDIDFGFAIAFNHDEATTTTSVDFMQMRVFYTEIADTGWKPPGTMVGNRAVSGATESWTNVDNAKLDDGNNASVVLNIGGDQSFGLAATNFDFSGIPGGVSILGIEIRITDYRVDIDDDQADFTDVSLILADNSDGSVSKHGDITAITNSLQTDTAGGSSDLWTETVSLADVQDSDWGFFIAGEIVTGISGSAFDIDLLEMKIYYVDPGGQTEFPPVGAAVLAGKDLQIPPSIKDVNAGASWTDGDTNINIDGQFLV